MKKTILLFTTILGGLIANAQNPYPLLSIDSISFVNAAKLSVLTGNTLPDYVNPTFKDTIYRDTVRFEGIVISNPKAYGLSVSRKAAYIQRKGGGPWSGALVMCEPSGTGTTLATLNTETKFYDNMVVGYKVRITGVIRDFGGETQINLIRSNPNWENGVEQVSLTPDTLVYTEITADKLMLGNPNSSSRIPQKLTGEQYEGTLVRLRNVTVYSVVNIISGNSNRTSWSVIDDNGNVIEVRDFSSYFRRDAIGDSTGLNVVDPNRFIAPAIGTRLDFIQGVVTEYAVSGAARYGIAPIYPGDYKVCTSCPPSIRFISKNPSIVKSSDTTKLVFEITVGDTTIASNKLFFKNSVSNTMDSVSLTAVPSYPNYYLAQIPPSNTECVMTYWVKATDKKDRTTLIPDPFSFGNKYYITGPNGVDNIRALQTSVVPNGTSIWNGDSLLGINVKGVVTALNYGNMVTIQDGQGANSAIFVQRNSGADSAAKWQLGDSVLITRAKVTENFNVTTLYNVLSSVISSGNPLPAFQTDLSIDSFAVGSVDYSRKWEGVLVKFDSLTVTTKNADETTGGAFGEFAVSRNNGASFRIDDYNTNFKNYNNLVFVGMKMSYIQGPMYFANGNFKLIPRNAADADFSNIDTIKPVITIIGANPFSVKKDSVYTDLGATAMDDKEGNITSKIVKSGTVNTAITGTYIISYSVRDLAGNMDSVTRIVNVLSPDTIKPVITILGKNPDTLQRTTSYLDAGATAIDNIDGIITSKITKVSTIDSSKTGTYTITYSVSDLAGNTQTAVRTVVVVNKTNVNEISGIASNISVYPSPAYAELNISIENINQLPAQLVITDILGKEIMKQTINAKNFNEQLNISQLNNGVYILNISNANGMQTVKFMVSGK
jgi:hypothetical protein